VIYVYNLKTDKDIALSYLQHQVNFKHSLIESLCFIRYLERNIPDIVFN